MRAVLVNPALGYLHGVDGVMLLMLASFTGKNTQEQDKCQQ
jgi:hypothetical protein